MISATFFFLFSQLGVGMLLVSLAISPRLIGPGFFAFNGKTAAVLMGLAIGFDALFPSPVRESRLPVLLLALSTALAVLYVIGIGRERYGEARVLLWTAVTLGLGAVALDASAFVRLMELGGWERWLLVGHHLAATALLGSGMLTMVFGHWYLVVPNLSIEPLRLLSRIYIATIVLRGVTIVGSLGVLELEQGPGLAAMASELFLRQGLFFWPRILFGFGIPLLLGFMILSTVRIRHTQAATGLLYLVVVALLFGEFFSKFLLFGLRLPI
jgi:hypothetical protein